MGLRSRIKDLEIELSHLTEWVRIHCQYEFVECETCGCLVKKDIAVRGKAIVKTIHVPPGIGDYFTIWGHDKEILFYPYYCKIHAPKGKK